MSETRTVFGYIEEICECDCFEELRELLGEFGVEFDEDTWYVDLLEAADNDDRVFVVIDDLLYEIVVEDDLEDGEYFSVVRKCKPGRLEFFTSFYDGGCSLSEAIEDGVRSYML